eukprot:159907_1
MKSIIASLFAIYSLSSGNRLLLQLPVVLPPMASGNPPPSSFECVEPYQVEDPLTGQMEANPLSCAGTTKVFENPAQMFDFKASALAAAAECELHFNYGIAG